MSQPQPVEEYVITFVEYDCPAGENGGVLLTRRVTSRAPIHDAYEGPHGTTSFRYFDRQVQVFDVDGKQVHVSSARPDYRVNYSGTYHVGGSKLTLDEIREQEPLAEVLIEMLQHEGAAAAVRSADGTYRPFLEGDEHIVRPAF